jgi:dihydrofolate synthase/folylpolyglutamate synthase
MNIEEALQKLFSLRRLGIKLGLDNIKKLLDHLDNPQNSFKSIHIAGSNGKGSTASFIASILMEAGFKVGLFTSPHYVEFNERIRINGEKISNEYIAEYISGLESYIDNNEITFFEITAALAFEYFKNNKVDYAIIETGLGGRLDATNVLNPVASVITSISLEHTKILGETIELVALEKGGIIKSNSKTFLGFMPDSARSVLEEKAEELNSEHYHVQEFTELNNDFLKLKIDENKIWLYRTPLDGFHQIKNAALAILTVSKTIENIKSAAYFKGISNVVTNTGIQGRYEIICENPRVIFDSAHNPEGMSAFIEEFKKEYNNYSERIAIFGAMRDKNLNEMIKIFSPYFTKVLVTSIDYDRAASKEELQGIFIQQNLKAELLSDPVEYLNRFILENKNGCLVIIGSIYILGEVKSQISKKDLTF